jgi:transcriptional regulator GlxA family with amidase domain
MAGDRTSRGYSGSTRPTTDREHQFRLPDDTTTPSRGVVRGHVVTAVGLLRDRLAEPWTLNSLAEEVHLSRSQHVRSFAATGMSPMA